MKSVLISIQPKWCELIASGKKTVEVRKTKPKLETPFKVYIYCTKNKEKLIEVIHEGDEVYGFIHKGKPNFIKTFGENWTIYGAFKGGKVIGEFVCDKITMAECGNYAILLRSETQLHAFDLLDYADEKTVYGWHISNLVIYDKPRELSEFYHYCGDNPNCDGCEAHYYSNTECGKEDYCCSPIEGCKPLKRPPQSWGYVESEDTE